MLRSLITDLSSQTTESDLIERFGTVKQNYAGSVHVTPADKHFSHISLVRSAQTDDIAHVRLELTDNIPLSNLSATFGDYQSIDSGHGEPKTVMFQTTTTDTPYHIVMLVEIEDDNVTAITLRRDPHA